MSRNLALLVTLLLLIALLLFFQTETNKNESSSVNTKEEVASIQSDPAFEKWREFSPSDGGFKVLLPSLPQHVKDRFADPITKEPRKYDAFLTTEEEGKPVFMISAITFPRKLEKGEDTNTLLRSFIEQILSKNGNNQLQSITNSTFQNLPSIDFSFINGNAVLAGKAFAHSKTLYILTMGHDKTLFNQTVLDFFINSFNLDNMSNREVNNDSENHE